MKDNSLDGHRGKVALSDTTRNTVQSSNNSNSSSGGGKCDLKTSPSTPIGATGGTTTVSVTVTSNSTTNNNDGTTATNFDDDYNEWELGIGDLIIDLDADIEKTNERQNSNGSQQPGVPSTQHHSHHHHSGHHHHHHHHQHSHHQNGTLSVASPGGSTSITSSSSTSATTFTFLEPQTSCSSNPAAAMSNSKSSRLVSGSGGSGGAINCATSNAIANSCSVVSSGANTNCNSNGIASNSSTSGTVEHQATVDKGLKMKIKRKTVGSKYSEAKHEIVQSDIKATTVSQHNLCDSAAASNSVNGAVGSSASSSSTTVETPKSKHSSGKGRNSSHREKKEKNRDKDKSSSARNSVCTSVPLVEVDGVLGVTTPPLKISNTSISLPSPVPVTGSNSTTVSECSSSTFSTPQTSRTIVTSNNSNSTSTNSGVDIANSNNTSVETVPTIGTSVPQAVSNSPPMPNLTLKLENKFSPGTPNATVVKQEERSNSPPLKKIKLECPEKIEGDSIDSPFPPEMKDTSTCTSVGTITEPDCLGPCEPGTSVMLEGIVWQETEGGVLVVNVTWRGKTYVGTLLDCTKHDWAPPRFCESPTSDVDSKATKGRGKRGRGGNSNSSEVNTYDARNCVQSKLRNGKGRRTTINSNNFTVPGSPAKSDSGNLSSKRKGRPADLEISSSPSESKNSKRSRLQSRATPPTTTSSSVEFPQPSSPVLIVCPEPNCSKKYKHINGLRYHQTHAHSGSDGSKLDDTNTEDSKDVTNSSDNEGSIQENMSVPPSPAMSFTNSASPHPLNGKSSQNDTISSSGLTGLPETDPYNLTPDLSTLASVAISDSKTNQKSGSGSRATPTPAPLQLMVSQELPVVVSADAATSSAATLSSSSFTAAVTVPISATPVISIASADVLSSSVSGETSSNSVIHSSSALDTSVVSPAVTVSIPASHVIFNQALSVGINCATSSTYTTTATIANHSSSTVPPPRTTVNATTFVPISSVVPNVSVSSPSSSASTPDKLKTKQQDRPDKYKPKSPMSASAPGVRPIVPAPSPQLMSLSANIPASHTGMSAGAHNLVTSSLKPIQPKPTILGEPSTINPALESLKKEKSKHKKKSKDKDRERKVGPISLSSGKISGHPNEECEPVELAPYPSLDVVPGSRDTINTASLPLSGAAHAAMSPLTGQVKPPDSTLDMTMGDDNINENIQSPAYSDISDANDTAPVLESEVPSVKEKDDKVGKSTPDAAQSPAANISAYGMYPYYSQPPYLLPSVSPQSSISGTQTPNAVEKVEQSKKLEQERIKESRPWSNPSNDLIRERHSVEQEQSNKKAVREESSSNSGAISSTSSNVALQDYQVQQPYPYPYGYVQGYPYSVEPAYHMHLLDTDPHYKQQYKQYIEDQQRQYKEQQYQQQHSHHHHQQQHNQQQQHHSQHQSHHQSKTHHSSLPKEERDRSREHKERTSATDKMPIHAEHVNKQQHSSVSFSASKEHDLREISEGRPPSLPTQSRGENCTTSSSASLKEKQNENHQILKENIELKSQMDDNKNKSNQYEMAMLYERHREDVRRFYMYHERIIENQQHKLEPGLHHHTHHHQTIQPHIQSIPSLSSSAASSSIKSHKEDLSGSVSSHSKQSHYSESSRSSSVISPAKSDHSKAPSSRPHSTSSPKGSSVRDSSITASKEYSSSGSSRDSSLSKKESSNNSSSSKSSDRSESFREEKIKSEKTKVDIKTEPEGQKPTMETTGPPPPPTNAYAYLHPSYLQPPPPHFPHMPFEPAHAVYRSGLNPMIMSTPHYGSSPYVHSQLRYVPPGACELPAHSQPSDPLGNKLHPPGPPKALELLHQVSQHYTTHKIHELQEHALMSPTPTSTPVSSSMPSTSSSTVSSKVSSTEPVVAVAKAEGSSGRESSRSPPTQRHLHTHHHTHVGVGYPIYDPYGAIIASPAPGVDVKPIHSLHQVKTPPTGRYWQ